MNLTLQLNLLRTIDTFADFALEIDSLSRHLSNEMVTTLEQTWSEAITDSFSETIQESEESGEFN